MIKNFFQDYFSDRNYALLYGQNAFKGAAFLTMGLFIGGWLYKMGLDLHWIVLYQALNFTLMGLISPFGSYLAGRYGMFITFGLSFLCYFLSLISLSLSADGIIFILLGLFFSSVANGLQNPPDMMLHAVYVQNKNRGRAFSVVNCISTLITLFAVLGSGWLIENFGLFAISFICGFFWLCSLLCIASMDDRLKTTDVIDIKGLYGDVFKQENRDLLGLSFGFQFLIISSFTFVPILLYISTENFQDLSIIAAFAIAVQVVILLLHGIWVDKTTNHSPLRFALMTHSLGLLVYSFISSGKFGLFFADTMQRTGLLMFFGAIFPRVHKSIIDNKKPVLSFGAIWHMSICFWEFIVLNIMALVIPIYNGA